MPPRGRASQGDEDRAAVCPGTGPRFFFFFFSPSLCFRLLFSRLSLPPGAAAAETGPGLQVTVVTKALSKKCTIPELPEVLTLHLQRFYLDYSYMTYRKNNCPVEIPLQLSVQEEKDGLHKYDLYALINHTGSLSGGHYYADIKSFDEQWYEFNDSWVHRIQKDHHVRHFTSHTACLLFFRKSPEQHTPEANDQQEMDDPKPKQDHTSAETLSNQTNKTSTQICNDPCNLPQKDITHKDSPEYSDCSTVNTSDSNAETKSKTSQTVTESTPNTPVQSTEGCNNSQSTQEDDQSGTFTFSLRQKPEEIKDTQSEEENPPLTGEITAPEQHTPEANDQREMDDPKPKQDHASAETLNSHTSCVLL